MTQTRLPNLLLDHEQIRRHSMQSLFESLDNLCEGTVVVDRDARIVWINERYAMRLGAISATDAVGRAIEEVIPNSLMRQVVSTGQPILLDLLETPDTTFVVTRIPLKDEQVALSRGLAFPGLVAYTETRVGSAESCVTRASNGSSVGSLVATGSFLIRGN